jgi:DNA mismatch repair ATPase MutL
MPFIPFVTPDGLPVKTLCEKNQVRLNFDPTKLQVRPEEVATAQMVIKNQLTEILLDYLHGKPKNEQTAYEAEEITMQFWKDLVKRGGVEW